MTWKRKPDGMAISRLPEWRAANSRIWHYSRSMLKCGMSIADIDEVRGDLLVFLYQQGRLFDETRGKKTTFLWFIANRFVWRAMDSHRIQRARMAEYRGDQRTVPPVRTDEEVAELVRRLMRPLSPRRRTLVTLWAAGWTMERLGKRYNLTRERIRQLINRALRLMKDEALRISHKAGMSADEYWSDLLCHR